MDPPLVQTRKLTFRCQEQKLVDTAPLSLLLAQHFETSVSVTIDGNEVHCLAGHESSAQVLSFTDGN